MKLRIARSLFSVFAASLTLASLAGCPAATKPPVMAVAKVDGKGPFGRLTLPKTARVVWIVYRETWRLPTPMEIESSGEPQPVDGKPATPSLRRRDLLTIAVLAPDAQGYVTPPSAPPIGSQKKGEEWELNRVHAIVVAPGLSVIDWDSHAFESSPTPAETAPVAPDALHAIEPGCEAVEGLAAFFRDFPQGIRTGLPAREFANVAYPVVGSMLSTIIERLPGPGDDASYDPDAEDDGDPATQPKKEKTCEGYGEMSKALRGQLYALRAWVGTQPLDDDAEDTPESKKSKPPPPMPIAGVAHDARWTAVVQLWSLGDAGAPSIHAGLASNDKDERLAALVAAWGAQSAVPVIPDLLKVVRGKDARERAYALEALRHAGTPSAASVPALVDLLAAGDGGAEIDAWATSALVAMGPNARSAAKPLIEIVKTSKDADRRARALEALRAIGPNAGDVLNELVDLLRSPDAPTADGALAVLRALGEGSKPVLPALIAASKDPVAGTRERACLAIAAIGKSATDAIEPLKERLADPDERVRLAALSAYAALGPASAPAVDAIKPTLFDTSPAVRTQAARTVAAIGKPAVKLAPFLGDLLADPVPTVAEAAATTLGAFGPEAKPALPKLVALLEKTTNDNARRAAANALVEIGPDAAPEIPKIVAALEKSGAWYLPQVIERMGKTMKRPAAAQLGKLLAGKPEPIERAAIVALGSLGKDGASEVPKLTKLLEQPGLSSYAFTALGNMGEAASPSIDKILDVLSRRNDLRNLCLTTLPKLGPKVVAPMTKLMVDPKKDAQLRLAIVRALFEVGPKAAPSTLPMLETLELLSPSDTWTVSGFRRLGKDAVPKLVAATKEKKPTVRRLAVLALGYLPPEAAKDAIAALLGVGVDDPPLKGDATSAITRYGKAVAVPILNGILADATKKKLHDPAREMLGRLG